jgi:hypothetical protein
MSLLSRLVEPAEGEEKIPSHQFMAALAEYKRGAVTGAQVASAFNLSPTETTQLQGWLDNLDDDTINRQIVHDVLMLAEYGLYTQTQVATRLSV